jgi:hypothetical protein
VVVARAARADPLARLADHLEHTDAVDIDRVDVTHVETGEEPDSTPIFADLAGRVALRTPCRLIATEERVPVDVDVDAHSGDELVAEVVGERLPELVAQHSPFDERTRDRKQVLDAHSIHPEIGSGMRSAS